MVMGAGLALAPSRPQRAWRVPRMLQISSLPRSTMANEGIDFVIGPRSMLPSCADAGVHHEPAQIINQISFRPGPAQKMMMYTAILTCFGIVHATSADSLTTSTTRGGPRNAPLHHFPRKLVDAQRQAGGVDQAARPASQGGRRGLWRVACCEHRDRIVVLVFGICRAGAQLHPGACSVHRRPRCRRRCARRGRPTPSPADMQLAPAGRLAAPAPIWTTSALRAQAPRAKGADDWREARFGAVASTLAPQRDIVAVGTAADVVKFAVRRPSGRVAPTGKRVDGGIVNSRTRRADRLGRRFRSGTRALVPASLRALKVGLLGGSLGAAGVGAFSPPPATARTASSCWPSASRWPPPRRRRRRRGRHR